MINIRGHSFQRKMGKGEFRNAKFELRISFQQISSRNSNSQNSQFEIRNPQFAIRNSQFEIRNSQFEIRNPQFEIRNSSSYL